MRETKEVIKDSINGDREVSKFSVKVATNMELAKNLKGTSFVGHGGYG